MRPLTFLFLVAAFSFLIGFEIISRSYTQFSILKWMGPALFAATLAGYSAFNFGNIKKLFSNKGARLSAGSGAVLILGVLIVIGLSLLTTKPRFNASIDLTRSQVNTLGAQSKNILKIINEKSLEVKVKGYFANEEVKANFENLFFLYRQISSTIAVTYVDPVKDKLMAQADELTAANTAIFSLGEKEYRITTFNEEKITTALTNIVKGKSKRIAFTSGHGEGGISKKEAKGYFKAAQLLEQNKFKVDELNLSEVNILEDEIDLLVIAGPVYDFSKIEIEKLVSFARKGGAVLVMCDAVTPVENINEFIGTFGITFNNDYLLLKPDDPRAQMLGQNTALVTDFDKVHSITRDFSTNGIVAVPMANSRSLSVDTSVANASPEVIAKTSPIILRINNVLKASDLKKIDKDRLEDGVFNVMAISNIKKGDDGFGGRVLAVGSAQMASNYGAQTSQNLDLFMNSINYLTRDEDFISIRPKKILDSSLDVSSSFSQVLLDFITYFYPALFVFVGTFFWMRRRKM
ncbi:Gldg family protein [Oligoflexaceae bacterium]|nr:Gldg family protein [Oligoflexaceae bacterium]